MARMTELAGAHLFQGAKPVGALHLVYWWCGDLPLVPAADLVGFISIPEVVPQSI